jgi:hypothetical protein
MSRASSLTAIPPDGLILAGLAGDNPLAFLAALGTLRVLDTCWPGRRVRMSWLLSGSWRPVLHVDGACERAEVIPTLHSRLRGRDRAPEFTLTDGEDEQPRELTLPPEAFAQIARRAAEQATRDDRNWADFCAAYGSDAFPDEESIRDTALRFTSGQQSFLGSIRELATEPSPAPAGRRQAATKDVGGGTAAHHLEHALFEPWSYSDPRPSLRWDPVDDRRYALRAFDPTDPATSPILTVRGANRLAVEALPWLPTFPSGGSVATRGFLRRGRELFFSWPIWDRPLTAATVASLLGLAELVADKPRRSELGPRGVVDVFRARRVGGYYRNFTPGVACWGQNARRPGASTAVPM